jgi:hypothetical protein
MPDCNSCHEPFADFGELADHILNDQEHHPIKSINWARSFKLRHAIYAKKMPERTPYTEQDKINRENCQRVLSGELKIVDSFCPLCRRSSRHPIPIEHAENPMSWRVNKVLQITCESCNIKSRRH